MTPRRAGGPAPLLALAALAALAAAVAAPEPARAETRRVEVEASGPSRSEAVAAAIEGAVAGVAASLVGSGDPRARDPETPWAEVLARPARDFSLRYRVVEDLGLRPPEAAGPEAPPVHAVRAEVWVDVEAVAARLQERGIPVAGSRVAPVERFVLEVRDPPSWEAVAQLRDLLREQAGASVAVPERFEAGLAVLRVEAPGGPVAVLDRLLAALPPGWELEPVGIEEARLAVRVARRGGGDEAGPPAGPFDRQRPDR